MAHTTEVIAAKELNDEQTAYLVRCCGEKLTDSWVTINVNADFDAELKAHRDRVEAKHERKHAHRAKHKELFSSISLERNDAVRKIIEFHKDGSKTEKEL